MAINSPKPTGVGIRECLYFPLLYVYGVNSGTHSYALILSALMLKRTTSSTNEVKIIAIMRDYKKLEGVAVSLHFEGVVERGRLGGRGVEGLQVLRFIHSRPRSAWLTYVNL